MSTDSAPPASARAPSRRPVRGITHITVAALLLVASRGSAAAGGAPPIQLVLPLITTLAVGHSFMEAQLDGDGPAGFRNRARAALSFLPAALRVPDLYVLDITDRDPPPFAAPLDRTTYASFNLLPRRYSQGRSLSVLYATEGVPALRNTSTLFGLKFSLEF
jgi:hypothetical protein